MKILIVDDEIKIREVVKEYAKVYEFECDEASDGLEAIHLNQLNDYDCIILDIMMPKVDGLKVLKVIRQLEKQQNVPDEEHLKIIMMTALADVGYVDEAFRQGCDAYASKPVDTDKVENVMRNLGLIE